MRCTNILFNLLIASLFGIAGLWLRYLNDKIHPIFLSFFLVSKTTTPKPTAFFEPLINLASTVDKLFVTLQTVKYKIKEEDLVIPTYNISQNLTTCDDIKSEIAKIKNLSATTGNISNTLKNTTSTLSTAVDRLSSNNGPLAGIFIATSEIVQSAANLTSNQASQFNNSLNYNEKLIQQLKRNATAMGCN